jgi:hypothetical protein
MVARSDNTIFQKCATARWSAVTAVGAGAITYLAAMTTGPIVWAWGVVFAVTLFCLHQIRQGRVSFGTRFPDCPNARPARESGRGALA